MTPVPSSNNRWLVLVGGGGCGRWQAGALDALAQAGLLSDLAGIVGTSVGGINACLLGASLAQGRGAGGVIQAWAAIQKDEDIYKPSLTAILGKWWAHPFDVLGAAKGFLFGPAAVDTTPLADLAHKFLDGWNTDRVQSITGIQVRARALNYSTGVADTLKGDMVAMVLCTSAIEGVFPRRWQYGDGGAVDNCPIDVALANGGQQILVVYCGPEDPLPIEAPEVAVDSTHEDKNGSTGLKDGLAVLSSITQMNETMVDQAATAAELKGLCRVVHCYPTESTGSALDFTERGLLQRGQQEAAKAITEAKALGW